MTPKQRIKKYEEALEYFQTDKYSVQGICNLLGCVRRRGINFAKEYPELVKVRPKRDPLYNTFMYWWDLTPGGVKQRIKALKKMIKEAKTKTK